MSEESEEEMNIFKKLFKKKRDWAKYFEEFDKRCLRCESCKTCNRICIKKDENGKCLDFDPINLIDELDNYEIDKKIMNDLEKL